MTYADCVNSVEGLPKRHLFFEGHLLAWNFYSGNRSIEFCIGKMLSVSIDISRKEWVCRMERPDWYLELWFGRISRENLEIWFGGVSGTYLSDHLTPCRGQKVRGAPKT